MIKRITICALRAILIAITVWLILKFDFLFALSALIATIITFIPSLIKKSYKIDFPWLIEFLIITVLLLHILGEFLEWYSAIGFYSSMMHFLGTAIIALLAFIIIYTLNLTKNAKLSFFMIGFFTVIFALAIGSVWEIGEFVFDQILGTQLQGDGKDPLVDTMWDLIWDGIAGLFIAIIGTSTNYIIKNKDLIKPFKMLVQKIFRKLKKFKIRRKIVPGEGNKHAKIMLIGIAPGAQEIKQNKPFIGPAGKWLDKILKKNKIDRKKLYITNLIKVKLPNNRKPTEKEIKKFLPQLKKEIKQIKPKIIVLLGNSVSEALLNKKINGIRGKFIKKDKMAYLPTYHPSAARFTKIRKIIEKDFKLINQN